MSSQLRSQEAHEQPEISRYLRMLQQLGDYGVKETVHGNPIFIKHKTGELTQNERELIAEQAFFLEEHIGKLAAIGQEEAIKGKSAALAASLEQFTARQQTNPSELAIVHRATLGLIKTLNELGAGKDHIEIGAAVYALSRMSAAEKVLSPEENGTGTVRESTHQALQKADILDPETQGEEPQYFPEIEIPPSSQQVAELEKALENYVTGRYTFQNCILGGIEKVVAAKKKFYTELAADFGAQKNITHSSVHAVEQADSRQLKVSNLF